MRARTVLLQQKCTVQVYTGSGQAGQSVRRPPLPLSVQLQALPSSLREDSKQIVMDYQSANWCLEWKAKWLRASNLGIMSRHFHLSHPLWAQPHPHSFVSWLKEAKKKYQGTQSVCAVLSEVQLCVHDETANGDSELWKEVKLSRMCSNLLSCLFTRNDPRPPLNQLDISLALRW